MGNIVAPSILSADFSRLGEELDRMEKAGADWVHIDVMDGNFVPNLTFGAPVVKSLRKLTELPFDCHLMVEHPETYFRDFKSAGADLLCIHVEATRHLHRAVQQIHDLGCKAGVALNPATSLTAVEEILPYVDMVLVMSVNPGFGGQSFIETSVAKVAALKKMIADRNLHVDIEIDGGVNDKNIRAVSEAGANVIVAGSFVFGAEDMRAAVACLK